MNRSLVLLSSLILTAVLLAACAGETPEASVTEAPASTESTDEAAVTEDSSEASMEEASTTSSDDVAEAPDDSEDMEESTESTEDAENTPEVMTLTLDELAAYNGKDGNPAYVAVDGIIYDVTDVPAWSGGTHNGNMAGQDVTKAIAKAPHGTSKLENLPIVGELAE